MKSDKRNNTDADAKRDRVRTPLYSPIYDLAISSFAGGAALAAACNEKARLLIRGHQHIFDFLSRNIDYEHEWIWIHAASLGEFEQGRPLIERFRRHHPELKILLTFFSPSGYEIRKDYPGADLISYLPFDTFYNANRFINIVKPKMAIFVKYEFWRNYLCLLGKRGIPTYLVSGIFRKDQCFFKPFGGFMRNWLKNFTRMYVQDETSKSLLNSIGFNNVVVAGDTRFDRVTDICSQRKPIPELEEFKKDATLLFMAGSSWPQDEEIYSQWVIDTQGVKCVIAPHEFDERRIEKLKALFKGMAVTLSEIRKNPETMQGKRVMIIDCFGLLSSAYSYADLAYVGGAFGAGLHNINEAAVYDIPVVFGPKYEKFLEANELITLGGAFSIDSEESFRRIADRLTYDPQERKKHGKWAGDYIREKIGASDRIFKDLTNQIKTS